MVQSGAMSREGKTKDFFISRTGADADWAQWIASVLEDKGYSVIIQDWDFRPGGNFVLDMHRGLQGAKHVIAVLSQDYLDESPFGQPEWAEAFRQDPEGKEGVLVPVRVRPCEPAGVLGARTFIDLVGLNEQAAEARLLDGVKEGRRKPSGKPVFPGKPRPALPGSHPPLGNLPPRNPSYAGRDELLKELQKALTQSKGTVLAMHGLGGVGKTQLAIEYAYRHAVDAKDYDHVFWVRAEEPAQLSSDYAALAVQLGLVDREAQDQTAMIEATRTWLESNGGWLLVFDNTPGPDSVREFLPRAGGGHALITSRHTGWSGTAESLRVDVFTPEESREFIHRRLGAEVKGADDLRQELGDLPLALELAASYIAFSRITIDEYTARLRTGEGDDGAPFDVFLSYGHEDVELVERLATRLRGDAGLKVWLDKWVLVPGEPWQREMAKGLERAARTCAVCLGANTPEGWFQEEIEKALGRQVRDRTFRVIPVILPGGRCGDIEGFLDLRTWVDFKDGIDDRYAFHRLVSGIRGTAPGPYPDREESENDQGPAVNRARGHLMILRDLEPLLRSEIILEYERRVLDTIIDTRDTHD